MIRECASLKWDRLHSLVLDLQPTLQRNSYFLAPNNQAGGEMEELSRY